MIIFELSALLGKNCREVRWRDQLGGGLSCSGGRQWELNHRDEYKKETAITQKK